MLDTICYFIDKYQLLCPTIRKFLFWGAEEQREGLFVLISYVVLCITGVSLIAKRKIIWWFLVRYLVLVVILILFLVADTMEYHFMMLHCYKGGNKFRTFDSVSPELLQSMGLYALTLTYAELGTLSLYYYRFTMLISYQKKNNACSIYHYGDLFCVLLFFSTSRSRIVGSGENFFGIACYWFANGSYIINRHLASLLSCHYFVQELKIATEGRNFFERGMNWNKTCMVCLKIKKISIITEQFLSKIFL